MANRISFFLAFGCQVVSFVLCGLSYGTGYWLVATGENRLFLRLGLWETCFDGYEHTSDLVGKAYYGCWWIFHKEYSYIRDWIMPPWFIAVQTLMTFALVCEFLLLVLIPMSANQGRSNRIHSLSCCVAALQSACLGISVTVFACMVGEDRTWMPRFDLNEMGWSFAFAVVAGFLSVFELIAISVYTLTIKYENLPKDEEYHQTKPVMPNMMPRVPKV